MNKGMVGMARVALVNVLVRDYDEAITFYTRAFGLELLEDTPQGGGKRWVVVGSHDGGAGLRLAVAKPEQAELVGRQNGTSVGFFLHVDDLDATLAQAVAHGAVATEGIREEPHGRVVILEDLYGNRWDVIQPAS
jgi:predicted enzyme related to lactoylglutathione lyase